jgi:3'-phosphoadenosine 5'-phosphosulfate (PAPS) 3'-phosphatase
LVFHLFYVFSNQKTENCPWRLATAFREDAANGTKGINDSSMILVYKMISLTKLISTCIDASRQGCLIIRDFQKEGMVEGILKEGGDIKSVVTKADIDAQARIVGGLRQMWGDGLLIIGEEDEEEALPQLYATPLDVNILTAVDGDDDEVPLEELTIFVDPLDGTREFVEGRLQNVACLIGIARNKSALAGVVGLPFPQGSADSDVVVHYAIGDKPESIGSWPSSSDNKSPLSNNKGMIILTGDSTNPILVNATSFALSIAKSNSETPPEHLIVGGTAAKLRRVATEENTLAILHFKTELWDTCAPEALINAKGGKLTDLFGSPLVHSPSRRFGNVFGVVASSGGADVAQLHDDLCTAMRADSTSVLAIFGKWIGAPDFSEPQAMGVARDLDGVPLGWIEDH